LHPILQMNQATSETCVNTVFLHFNFSDMRKLLILLFFVNTGWNVQAQATKIPAVDKSPLDVSYYPSNYPILKIQDKASEPLIARVIYSRPSRNSRKIFGDLVEYGNVWRLGANEATEVEFFQHVHIGGVRVKKGRYTVYCIPYAEKWTMVLNRETDTWGSFKYDQSKDVTRLDVPVQIQETPLENMAMYFEKSLNGINLVIQWDLVKVNLPITY